MPPKGDRQGTVRDLACAGWSHGQPIVAIGLGGSANASSSPGQVLHRNAHRGVGNGCRPGCLHQHAATEDERHRGELTGARGYVLTAGDKLKVTVFDEPNLTG